MQILSKFWNNFKTQPDIWFFYGFLATFTLSIRKVVKFYPIMGQFNEYTGIYLYLSDIFLILTLVSWGIVILRNKSLHLSRIRLVFGSLKTLITFLLFFNIWVFTSVFWSDNQLIALFRAVKILEFSLLFLYVAVRIVPPRYKCSTWNILRGRCGTNYKLYHSELDSESNSDEIPGQARNDSFVNVPPQYKCSTWNILRGKRGTFERFAECNTAIIFQIIVFLGLSQAIIGIWQFFSQHSVGLFWLKESLISPDLPGVAKIIFNGEKYIRAYGLFPHPNILGGFLVFSILLTWAYYKMFHVEHFIREGKCHPEFISETALNLIHGFQLKYGSMAGMTDTKGISPQKKCSIPVQMFHPGTNVPRGTNYQPCHTKFDSESKSDEIPDQVRNDNQTNVPPRYKCSTWNILRGRRPPRVDESLRVEAGGTLQLLSPFLKWRVGEACLPMRQGFLYVFLFIQLLALLLTFSKSAIIGLIIAILYILWKINKCSRKINILSLDKGNCSTWNILRGRRGTNYKLCHSELDSKSISDEIPDQVLNDRCSNVPRGTFTRTAMFHVEHYWKELSIFALILLLGFNHLNFDWNTFLLKSLGERKMYLDVSQEIVSRNPYLGIGIGQFVLEIPHNVPRGTLFESWQYQPVHNVFILLWSELGIVGLLVFLAFLKQVLSIDKLSIMCYNIYVTLLWGWSLVLFFDHYLWDIQAGQLLFWLVLGLIAAGGRNIEMSSRI